VGFAAFFRLQGRAIVIRVMASSAWDARQAILRTRFPGPAGIAEVVAWRAGLYAAAASIPRLSSFKLLVDLRGYEVSVMEPSVHKVQREIVPIFLATYHFRTGFIDFFGVKGDTVRYREEAHCRGVAHVHHDAPKMELYRQTLGRDDESFFSSLPEAEAWIASVPLEPKPLEKHPG
jgi:hypothetical protein